MIVNCQVNQAWRGQQEPSDTLKKVGEQARWWGIKIQL